MRIFLGITGASGAPYAARLVDALAAADCEIGVSASAAGVEVLATELYGEPRLPRDEVLARFTERAGGAATVFDPHDYSAPYASGSARVDGYVVCPCSMATAGTIATGGEANLIHRAAGVALKEGRKLVLVPRETPLSTIHLENLLKLRQAGAVILFAAPGFYHGASGAHAPAEPERALTGVASERLGIDDLVDFIAGRCLAQLGLDTTLVKPWGDE
jgi:4-hydroxy-3-polyprenylbenzoate decarboxylase